MEWRVHGPWTIVAVVALNIAIIAVMRFLAAFRYEADVSLRCFILLIIGGLANFWITLGLLPALIAIAPVCAVLFVARLLGRVSRFEPTSMTPRLAMNAYAAVALVYFIPIANLMTDHTLMGTVDVDCVNERCVRSLRPGTVYGVNQDRYRGPIARTQAEGADPRLLFLGDSSTFGFGVRYEDTYPALTRAMLRGNGFPNAEVLNAAVPGHTEAENIVRLRKYAHWRPTHVFIMGGWHFRNMSRPIDESELMTRLRLVRGIVFLGALTTHQMFQTEPKPEDQSLRLWAIAVSDLIAQIVRNGGVPVLLEYPAPDTNEGIVASEANLAALHHVPFIRLRERFAASSEAALLFDRCHPNDVGNRIIAGTIFDWFAAGQPNPVP